jgi:hypothetical protein
MSRRNSQFSLPALCICTYFAGCAAHPRESCRVDLSPLKPGDRITVNFFSRTCILCFGPPDYSIDQQGFVRFGTIAIQVAGLTPSEAGLKIRDAFMPQYYSDVEVAVGRPRPQHAADWSQQFSSNATPETPSVGSHR